MTGSARTSRTIVSSSLQGNAWVLPEVETRVSSALAERFSLPPVVAEALLRRGIGLEEALHYLSPTLKHSLPDPSHLKDMDVAATRLAAAVMAGETIAIFGDYDVDGATSTALFTRYFRALGVPTLIHIPDRQKEGYGPNTEALLALKEKGARIVITVDCGTLAFEPIAAARAAGLEVIVVDHHQGEARLPEALAVINPNRFDETSPHRQLAAVGVSFLLAVAVNRELRAQGWFATHKEPEVKQLLDLVALGTVCDVMPLTGVNRALVSQGLKVMAAGENIGLRALAQVGRLNEVPNVYAAGFVLGPRINAGGRVGKSDLGARLLATEDALEADMLAKQLDQFNEERRAIEHVVFEAALAQAKNQHNQPFLLLADQHWHPGVVGVVAGRLKEMYKKPVAVLSVNEGVGKASARSVSGFDLGAAVINACAEGLLMGGGGHAMAAGFTLAMEKMDALHAHLCACVDKALAGKREAHLVLDGAVAIGGANHALASAEAQLHPCGVGNPSLKIALQHAKVVQIDILKEQHLRLILVDETTKSRLVAMAFRALPSAFGEQLLGLKGRTIHAAGQLKLREYRGKEDLSFILEDAALVA